MAILETISRKIDEIKKNSPEELSRIYKVLKILNEAIKALSDEEVFQNYDFSVAINLVNRNVNSFGIIDIEKNINDIKNVIIIRNKFDLDINYSSEQERALNCFKERLFGLKKQLEKMINEHKNNKVSDETFESLEDFKKLLEGKGRRKYYTYEMLESLFEVVDYDSLTYKDIEGLVSDLKIAKNNNELPTE